MPMVKSLKENIAVYRLALNHPDTPRSARVMLWLAVGYILLPFDLIPDFIPGLGQLDDIVIVSFLVRRALRRIPPHVMMQCREQIRRPIISEGA